MTISNQVIKYLKRKKKFVFGGELERVISAILECKPSTVSRILRDMAEHKVIYKDYENVGIRRKVRAVKYRV